MALARNQVRLLEVPYTVVGEGEACLREKVFNLKCIVVDKRKSTFNPNPAVCHKYYCFKRVCIDSFS